MLMPLVVIAQSANTTPVSGAEKSDGAGQLASAPKDDEVIMLEAYSVEAEQLKNSAAGLTNQRSKEAASIDAIGSVDFGKFSGSDIGDIMIRVPGVSVSSGKFAVIRGLSERYSPTLMDGVVIPSPDAEKQTPPMDIFPAKLLDAVVVHKTYQPDLPSFAAGGAIDLLTSPMPSERYASYSFGIRFDADVFKNDSYLSYDTGGNGDLFAGGKGDREKAPKPLPTQFYARSTPLVGEMRRLPPGYKGGINYSDIISLPRNQQIGFNILTSYDSDYESAEGSIERKRLAPLASLDDGLLGVNAGSKEYLRSEDTVLLGGLVSVGYKPSENHLLGAKVFVSKSSINEIQHNFNFTDQNNFGPIEVFPVSDGYKHHIYEINYRERLLLNGDVSGEHVFGDKDDGLKVNWRVGYLTATEDQPDQKTFAYVEDSLGNRYTPGAVFIPDGIDYRGGLTRTWRETEEKTRSYRVSAQKPFDIVLAEDVNVKIGVQADYTERNYNEIQADGWQGGEVLLSDPSAANDEIIGKLYNPVTATADATRDVEAIHASFTIPVTSKIKFVPGARIENLTISSTGNGVLGNITSNQFYSDNIALFPGVNPANPTTNIEQSGEIYPSFLLSFEPVEKLLLKISYSETLARPSLREVGSYFTKSVADDVYFHGNAGLKTSPVQSFDFRIEKFFSGADLVALSLFAKKIENPIERSRVILSNYSGLVETVFNNPDTADLRGVELEVRKNMRFLGATGERFTVGANFTYIDAEVGLLPGERNSLAPFYAAGGPTTRQLYDQPEWLGNADVTVDFPELRSKLTFTYRITSPVLVSAPADAAYARYKDGYEQLDGALSMSLGSWDFKLQVSNIFETSQDMVYDPNQTAGRIQYATESNSRSYSLTASREF